MKTSFILYFSLFCSLTAIAQKGSKFQHFADQIVSFSKPIQVLYNHIDANGNGYAELTNQKKQVLRFRLENEKIKVLHGKIAYQLFYYQDNYLRRIETFDTNGNRTGQTGSHNEATIDFIIEKPAVYQKKKQLIDDAEGNISMPDDQNEKIISVRLFDKKNLPIRVLQPTYLSSKEYWNYSVRMYWP